MFVMVNFSFLYIQLNPHTWVACDWVTSIEIIISLLLRQRDTSGSPSSLHMYDQQYNMNGSNSKVFFATINSDFIPRTWVMLCNYITGSLQKTLTCPQIFHTALNFQNLGGMGCDDKFSIFKRCTKRTLQFFFNDLPLYFTLPHPTFPVSIGKKLSTTTSKFTS